MKLSPEQHALIVAMRRDANRLREVAESDGQNDLGAALQDAAWALGVADAMLTGCAPGVPCDTCDGHGFFMVNAHGPQEVKCDTCSGTGNKSAVRYLRATP